MMISPRCVMNSIVYYGGICIVEWMLGIVEVWYFFIKNRCFSLSRREESYKLKLFACLIACMSAGSKNHHIFIKLDRRVTGGRELNLRLVSINY
jgi:hypothetical protein